MLYLKMVSASNLRLINHPYLDTAHSLLTCQLTSKEQNKITLDNGVKFKKHYRSELKECLIRSPKNIENCVIS